MLSGSRIVGLAGAFTALGTGIDGAAYNPASYAARDMWGAPALHVGHDARLVRTGSFRHRRLLQREPHGRPRHRGQHLLRPRPARPGGVWRRRRARHVPAVSARDHGRRRHDHELQRALRHRLLRRRGGGVPRSARGGRGSACRARREGSGAGPGRQLVSFSGFAPQFGAIIRPEGERYRIGASVNLPVSSSVADGSEGVQIIGEHYLPGR